MTTAADRVQAQWDVRRSELWLLTQAEVLNRLPQWMRADFDCPAGPHDWLWTRGPVSEPIGFVYAFCKNCPARRRTPCPEPDTQRDPLEVILSLQRSR